MAEKASVSQTEAFLHFIAQERVCIFRPKNGTHNKMASAHNNTRIREDSITQKGEIPQLFCGITRKMASNSQKLVPEAKEALNKFKMEAANEVGVNLKQGYNGDLTSKQAGSVGGQMVKKMIEKYENDIKTR